MNNKEKKIHTTKQEPAHQCPFCDGTIHMGDFPTCEKCRVEFRSCPDCGKLFSSSITVCPFCGCSVQS